MLWAIDGIDRRTGERKEWKIEAATDAEAREKARLMGISASAIRLGDSTLATSPGPQVAAPKD